jgi:glutamate-1-semialdehyde 2,1-aminomutase
VRVDSELKPAENETYRAGHPESERLWAQACDVFPEGVSGAAKFFAPFPVFLESTEGAHAVDVDGNRYVDLLMGAGPMLLGHGHPRVLSAIRDQLGRMTNPMMPARRSVELAERIRTHMPYLERLRFTNTGSEATRSAVRVARAVTGRQRLAKFEGNYHGSDDLFLVSTHSRELAGSDERPDAVVDYGGLRQGLERDVLVLPYNEPDIAAELIAAQADELAAVIMEPVAFSSGGGIPATREFAAAVRQATEEQGIVLIFDEVLCAYRMGLEGAPAYLGVTPDLAAIGKAVGGGMPLGAFGGRADFMEAALGREAADKKIFQSGTFTENPVSIAAGMAALDVLEEEPVLERANEAGRRLREGLAAIFREQDVDAAVTGVASIAQVHMGVEQAQNRRDVLRSDYQATRDFLLGMVARGVLWPPVHPAVTSGAHTPEDIDDVLNTAYDLLGSAA